ncbi:molybdopterin-dependent oxidoreductase [Salinarchaeum sp. IM2453]|uniref:molybdopterin-dependent oxidoreductase n=1 Tax=Salinarchaeum sp. IM2453 TaxID=2862870 RepID=UPI001C83F5B2|nr:molybdopterin-dependent oxidoreductase [Salinarchaeum sp. IM2453]QZA88667.1 molybdopterin-dependent oxidoreductase [Salinarchaeum sp. IM2453]
MSDNNNSSTDGGTDEQLSRRDFAKATGTVGAASVGGLSLSTASDFGSRWPWSGNGERGIGDFFEEYGAEDVAHTTCGLCHANCPIQVRLGDSDASDEGTGSIRKIAGNPYAFQMTYPNGQIPYGYDFDDEIAMGGGENTGSVRKDGWSLSGGRVCLKGQSGMQVAFDNNRVRKPLKRTGDRGDDEWEEISWEQAINEIINGDDDLGHDGLKEYEGWIDREEVQDAYDEVMDDNTDYDADDFADDYADVLVADKEELSETPELWELGPKSNQIVDMGGYRRFHTIRPRLWRNGLGSINSYHHAGVCGITCLTAAASGHKGGKGKGYQHPDIRNSEYIIAWGANPLVATKGPVWTASQISNARQNGLRLDVVDPRMSETAEKADKWVPVKPGADAALAFGMARWIIENRRYDETFLTNPSEQAAHEDGEKNWSDATHLVLVEKDAHKKRFNEEHPAHEYDPDVEFPNGPKARPEDLGIDGSGFVAKDQQTGELQATEEAAFDGELFVDETVTVDGEDIAVKSVFQLYRERAEQYELEEYAEMAGIDVEDIVELADEFTSHGKRAAIFPFRGLAQHPHGFYNSRSVLALQHLIGNYDWKGGQITPEGNIGTESAEYNKGSGRFDLGAIPNKHDKDPRAPWGVPLTKGGMVNYEESPFYDDGTSHEANYPAERPWFNLSVQEIQEVWPAAKEEYPYGAKALMFRAYGANNVTSASAGDTIPEIMQDQDNFELIVASDVIIGETSRYADYILPEPTYLERWESFDANQNKVLKDAKITRPVTRAFGEIPEENHPDEYDGPVPFENVLIHMWKEMELPGVGEDAMMDDPTYRDEPETYSLDRAEDMWLKLVANVAYDEDPVAQADEEEIEHLERSVEKGLGTTTAGNSITEMWKDALNTEEDWRRVVTVLNRGGRFEPPAESEKESYEEKFDRHGYDQEYVDRDPDSNAYDGDHMKYRLETRADFYDETLPEQFHSASGEPLDPMPAVCDGEFYNGETQLPIVSSDDARESHGDLQLINWKQTAMGIQRTIGAPWLREIQAENPLWINPKDADERGIEDGDTVVVQNQDRENNDVGAKEEVTATARVTEGIRPGVVGGAFAFGRETNGAVGATINGDGDSANMPESPVDDYGHFDHDPYDPAEDTTGYAKGQNTGFAVNHLMDIDPELGDTGVSDVIGGSHAQYSTFVDVEKA